MCDCEGAIADVIMYMNFRIMQGEHNQAFTFAPVGRRTCSARLLTKRYVAEMQIILSLIAILKSGNEYRVWVRR